MPGVWRILLLYRESLPFLSMPNAS